MARNRNKTNKNNFQDLSEEAEFKKGYKAGKTGSGKSCYPSKPRVSRGSVIKGVKDGNDISWHNPNDNMFNDATGITFNAQVGNPLKVDPDSSNAVNNWFGTDVRNPGICIMHWAPSLGAAKEVNDPINEATISLFQYLRRDKSGKEIYQPADIGMVIGALDSAYIFYTFCCKIYGMCHDVNIMNRYVPQAMVSAHSVNFKDINRSMADFHFWIADYARQLRGFYVPKGIHLFDRHKYMTEQIFTDGQSDKAQYYAYVPTHYFKFSEGIPSAPQSTLNYVMLINPATMGSSGSSNWLTAQQLMDFGDSLLAPLKQSETVRNILADMLTSFPENGSYSIGDIPTDYIVKPVYDEQALMMFENSYTYGFGNTLAGGYDQVTAINNSFMTDTTTITPNISQFTTQPKAWNAVQRSRQIFNFHHSSVTKEEIMYASRLSGFGFAGPADEDGTPSDAQLLKTHGSEICLDWTVWYYYFINTRATALQSFTTQSLFIANVGKVQNVSDITVSTTGEILNGAATVMKTFSNQMAIWSKFDWHPKIYPVILVEGSTGGTNILYVGDAYFDMETFAVVTEDQLEQMNLTSLLGLLVCRDMGKYSAEISK